MAFRRTPNQRKQNRKEGTLRRELRHYISGAQTTGAKVRFVATEAGDLVSTKLRLETVNTGATFIGDLHKNGTTVYTTQARRPTIADGAASKQSTESGAIEVKSFVAGDVLEFQVDQIGSTVAGSDLSLVIVYDAK